MATASVIGDARLVPDPEVITNEFHREFQAMLRAVKAHAAKSPAKKARARKVAARSTSAWSSQSYAIYLIANCAYYSKARGLKRQGGKP
jgi:hypothetical protein